MSEKGHSSLELDLDFGYVGVGWPKKKHCKTVLKKKKELFIRQKYNRSNRGLEMDSDCKLVKFFKVGNGFCSAELFRFPC